MRPSKCAKIAVRIAVLAVCTEPLAIKQRRFQSVIVTAAYVSSLIHNDTGQMLPDSIAHDSRLSVIDEEAFFGGRSGDMHKEAFRTTGEITVARER